ncbi:MAG TPA: sigma-70 family RNA polymerase sigma factor [Acidobacteriota bacterium]|nr:sigma-70 family RNA polymerase sigma factor [Acidobacteriota bacterium]
MSEDTGIGGSKSRFPTTHHSAILAAKSEDAQERSRALEVIVGAYWKPVYKYIRVQWRKSNEDAKDLTQSFFTRILEKEILQNFDPARAKFRTYLRTCLDGYLANEYKAAGRQKRGGDALILSLDYESAEGELKQMDIADPQNTEDYFEKEWVRSFFEYCLAELKRNLEKRGKLDQFQLFERYHMEGAEDLTYEKLGEEFNLSTSNVTNYLAAVRREFRKIVLERLRQLTVTDEEYAKEARILLGVKV